jgi:hypothetical protein
MRERLLTSDGGKGGAARVPVLLGLLFCLLCLPPILAGLPGADGLAWDAAVFHIPQINLFVADPFALVSYDAKATTLPFYHLAMAHLAAWLDAAPVGNQSIVLRLIHFALSFAGLLAALMTIARRRGAGEALILSLPLISSWHVISGAIFFGTDGPGLSLTLIALLLLLQDGPIRPRHAIAFAAVAAVRHLMLPYVAGAMLWKGSRGRQPRRALRLVAAMMPGGLLLSVYIYHWGGLTPPGMVARLNPGGIFVHSLLGQLAIAGIWGSAYGLLRRASWSRILARPGPVRHALIGGSIAILSLWLLVPTGFSPGEGRFGSVAWSIARLIPTGEHSIAILMLALLGSTAIILCATDCLDHGLEPLEMAGLALFLGGLMLTYAAYQRYSEPLCIASFAVALSRLPRDARVDPLAALPLLALAGMGPMRFWQAGLIQQISPG